MIHNTPHEGAGKTYKLKGGAEYRLEDWWDRVVGRSWTVCDGDPVALHYAMRRATSGLPVDDKVVYGRVFGSGQLVHVSELAEVIA